MQRPFKVILEWNEDGSGYTVIVPALPGCITEEPFSSASAKPFHRKKTHRA
ncbi:MAG: hypothetical protein RQM95_05310 [Syntrophaceticus schinkii]|nr:hypothetical protein [Syntrophaceticus schinkii]